MRLPSLAAVASSSSTTAPPPLVTDVIPTQGMRMIPCCLEFRFQRCIFACIISQLREGAKVAFHHLHSGLKRIIHENSRILTT
ncbi:unnamed protein product [Urochloa humidicola]